MRKRCNFEPEMQDFAVCTCVVYWYPAKNGVFVGAQQRKQKNDVDNKQSITVLATERLQKRNNQNILWVAR